ncbi:MAG: hypothetical protein LBP52_05940 [Burkholderiaceae bacterium]|jgi:hypothetical protein|nr:hypothetical protein [Burkholderiaceae bacterium]
MPTPKNCSRRNAIVFLLGALAVLVMHFAFHLFFFRFSLPGLLNFWLLGCYLAIFKLDGLLIPYVAGALALMGLGLKLIRKKYAVLVFLTGFELMLLIGMLAASVLV